MGTLKPLSTEQLFRLIDEQARLTGWKVPPTVQVARAVERAHGIGLDAEKEPDLERCVICGGLMDQDYENQVCSKCQRA